MPLVSVQKPGFVYYIPPKTGSSTLVERLRKTTRADMLYDKHGVYHDPAWLERKPTYLLTVRNPFSRAVSLWQFFRSQISFETFLASSDLYRFRGKLWHALPCTHWQEPVPQDAALNVIRLESFDRDLTRCGILKEGQRLPKINKTGRSRNAEGLVVKRDRPWQAYYESTWAEERVRQLYASDFQAYGYGGEVVES